MMESIWAVVILFAGISLATSNPVPLIAGLILAFIGTLVERFLK
jgi:hypothetical protein